MTSQLINGGDDNLPRKKNVNLLICFESSQCCVNELYNGTRGFGRGGGGGGEGQCHTVQCWKYCQGSRVCVCAGLTFGQRFRERGRGGGRTMLYGMGAMCCISSRHIHLWHVVNSGWTLDTLCAPGPPLPLHTSLFGVECRVAATTFKMIHQRGFYEDNNRQ